MTRHQKNLERAGWRAEWFVAVSLTTCLAFVFAGQTLWSKLANPWVLVFGFFWLFGVILGSAMSVVRHAEHLAALLGEPYGTLVLTLSVTFIEVTSISAVMLHGQNNPSLVRDTLIAVIMIILNGMVGISLLAGAWKHREQRLQPSGRQRLPGGDYPTGSPVAGAAQLHHDHGGPDAFSSAGVGAGLAHGRPVQRLSRRADRAASRLL